MLPKMVRRLAIAAATLFAANHLTSAAHAGVILWNKLGSTSEVLHSAYGPNLNFFNSPTGNDLPANPEFVPGEFGNALTIGPGNYGYNDYHTAVWNGVNQYLNPDRGTISVWYKQNSSPVYLDHDYYRLFGDLGSDTGVGLVSDDFAPVIRPPQLLFYANFGGAMSQVSYDSGSLNGTWIHVAGVWNRNGIDNTADKLRLYINGQVVASATVAGWGNTVGQFADIGGGRGPGGGERFAVDNLKVYDVAVTDFSNQFVEGIPEPATNCLVIAGVALTTLKRRTRAANLASR